MILRRYGESVHSVDLAFDSRALTEIGFKRAREPLFSMTDFEREYHRVGTHELEDEVEGLVHEEAEGELLRRLEERIRGLEAELGEDEVLFVESEPGIDHPKTRARTRNLVLEGENRFHFTVRVHPPLRLGVYRKVS